MKWKTFPFEFFMNEWLCYFHFVGKVFSERGGRKKEREEERKAKSFLFRFLRMTESEIARAIEWEKWLLQMRPSAEVASGSWKRALEINFLYWFRALFQTVPVNNFPQQSRHFNAFQHKHRKKESAAIHSVPKIAAAPVVSDMTNSVHCCHRLSFLLTWQRFNGETGWNEQEQGQKRDSIMKKYVVYIV